MDRAWFQCSNVKYEAFSDCVFNLNLRPYFVEFETAQSMSAVAKSASALPSVIAAVGLPTVVSAGVEAKLEFEITVQDSDVATDASAKLQDSATLASIAAVGPGIIVFCSHAPCGYRINRHDPIPFSHEPGTGTDSASVLNPRLLSSMASHGVESDTLQALPTPSTLNLVSNTCQALNTPYIW